MTSEQPRNVHFEEVAQGDSAVPPIEHLEPLCEGEVQKMRADAGLDQPSPYFPFLLSPLSKITQPAE